MDNCKCGKNDTGCACNDGNSENAYCPTELNRDGLLLKFKKLDERAIVPKYQTVGASGFDFHAIVSHVNPMGEEQDSYVVYPKSQYVVRTGLACVIPHNYEMQIRPRSGLSFKHQITVTNAPGTIDEDYIGPEIKILLYNLGDEPFEVKNGDRIAQGVVCPVLRPEIIEIDDFSEEDMKFNRGGGFGSTGK